MALVKNGVDNENNSNDSINHQASMEAITEESNVTNSTVFDRPSLRHSISFRQDGSPRMVECKRRVQRDQERIQNLYPQETILFH